jgi:hypothetical protein
MHGSVALTRPEDISPVCSLFHPQSLSPAYAKVKPPKFRVGSSQSWKDYCSLACAEANEATTLALQSARYYSSERIRFIIFPPKI